MISHRKIASSLLDGSLDVRGTPLPAGDGGLDIDDSLQRSIRSLS